MSRPTHSHGVMAAAPRQALRGLRLHPAHISGASASRGPRALPPSQVTRTLDATSLEVPLSRCPRLAISNNFLIEDISGEGVGLEVALPNTRVSWHYPQVLALPVIEVEVTIKDEQQGEDALPTFGGGKTRKASWLLVSEGGHMAACQALALLSMAGAVRTDFEAAIQLQDQVLGTGGFGTVVKAKALRPLAFLTSGNLGIAVKVMSEGAAPGPQAPAPPGAKPRDIFKAAVQETAVLLAAQTHPNILRFNGLWQSRQGMCLATECCDGGDLFSLVIRDGRVVDKLAPLVALAVCSALQHLEGVGIVHRDVKPENVLLDGNRAVLADFGLAAFSSDQAELSRRIGSPGYIAPEVLRGQPWSFKGDIFGAGASFFFMVTGQKCFIGADLAGTLRKTLSHEVKVDDQQLSHLNPDLRGFIVGLLIKDHSLRPSASKALAAPWLSRERPMDQRASRVEETASSTRIPEPRVMEAMQATRDSSCEPQSIQAARPVALGQPAERSGQLVTAAKSGVEQPQDTQGMADRIANAKHAPMRPITPPASRLPSEPHRPTTSQAARPGTSPRPAVTKRPSSACTTAGHVSRPSGKAAARPTTPQPSGKSDLSGARAWALRNQRRQDKDESPRAKAMGSLLAGG